MTRLDSSPVSAALLALPEAVPAAPLWRRPVVLAAAGLLASDAVTHLLHVDGGSLLGLGALAGGWWLLSRRRRLLPALPLDIDGWIARCDGVIGQFERLDPDAGPGLAFRRAELAALRATLERQELALALAGCQLPAAELQLRFVEALRGQRPLCLHWGEPLPSLSPDWRWPLALERADGLLFHLHLPLSAADLLWLQSRGSGPSQGSSQPIWLLIQVPMPRERSELLAELSCQWPGLEPERVILWNGAEQTLAQALEPLALWLARPDQGLRKATALRTFEQLHGRWQADLELLRRSQWQGLQQRTQWIVAAGVFASPLPSVDLVVLAIANGLMLQEMAQLWDCPWSLEQLRAAATELARAALALGLVEWSAQALMAVLKLHGATWLVAGAVQALSAAYLTRVVGRAMADVLAESCGVSQPDLERIRRRASLLVAEAAESEKLDWSGFVNQGRQWLQQQAAPA
ncbi:MAG: YcjF family protein [Cyanobacteria bacterium]|nr:YcjF family protein [Cyanobacteriota bacterium]